MKKVKYTGVRRQGTLRPRRMWSPGEVLDVEDEVAKDLVKAPGFEVVKKRRTRRKKDEEPVREEEPPLQQEEATPGPDEEVEEEE